MRIRPAACLLVTFLGASPALAQTGQQQQPTFRTGIDLLAVDVSVVDPDGNPVTDLRAPEFTVTVDGQPRRVVTAELVSYDEPEPRANPEPADTAFYTTNLYTRRGRLIVFVVDQSNIRLGGIQPLQKAVGGLLDRLNPADRVALVSIPEAGPQVDFTNDFERVRSAVGRLTGRASDIQGSGRTLSLNEAIALVRGGGDSQIVRARILLRECGENPPGSQLWEICEREVLREAEQMVREVHLRTDATLRVLRATIVGLREIDGPKTLIFISEALVMEDNPGATDLGALAAAARVSVNVLLLEASAVDVAMKGAPDPADRRRGSHGLEMVAGRSRGELYRVMGSGAAIFDRIQRELSAYYLLGVEATEADRDGKAHRIEVQVGRRNVVVRARREFLETSLPEAAGDRVEQAVAAAIASPILAVDVPLRVTSYAYQDADPGKVRLLVAAEIGDPDSEAAEYTLGLALFDRDGKLVAGHSEKLAVDAAAPGAERTPLTFAGALVADPGTYMLKVAAVDDQGRRGSVEHAAQAWQMAGEEFAISDLVLADGVTRSSALQPQVTARVHSGQLVGFVELYAKDPSILERARVTFEVAEEESGAPLTGGVAALGQGPSPGRRPAQAVIPVDLLPPGSYVARVNVALGDRAAGALARPFVVPSGGAVARATTPASAAPAALNVPAFERGAFLEREVLGYFLDRVTKASPASGRLAGTVARVKQGKFAGAALEAFELGDQAAAAFLRGVELYAKQQLNQAATQFRAAMQAGTSDPLPAAVFLGACFAAAGRERDAMPFWGRALGEDGLPPAVYTSIGHAWLRLGNPDTAVDALQRAARRGGDAEGLRALGVALIALEKPAEALASLDAYLAEHPQDPEALFAAMQALFTAYRDGAPPETLGDGRARAARYASAYRAANGPRQALVEKWAEFIARSAR